MKLKKDEKILLNKENSRAKVEIVRHKDPIMNNILVVKWINGKNKSESLMVEKDLSNWLNYLGKEGYKIVKNEEND
jgi:hypothetical protein